MNSTHVRIPVEVKERLDELLENGESIGALIIRLIDFYLSANTEDKGDGKGLSVNSPLTGGNSPSIPAQEMEDIKIALRTVDENNRANTEAISRCDASARAAFQQIVEMQSREKLTVQDLDNFEDKLRELQNRVETLEGITHSPGPDRSHLQVSTALSTDAPVAPAIDGAGERIPLTQDMQNEIISIVDSLMAAGMHQKDIADSIGINRNTMKGIVNKRSPAQTITKDAYKRLMGLREGNRA